MYVIANTEFFFDAEGLAEQFNREYKNGDVKAKDINEWFMKEYKYQLFWETIDLSNEQIETLKSAFKKEIIEHYI
jgi:hypothetical protein